MEYTKVVVLNM